MTPQPTPAECRWASRGRKHCYQGMHQVTCTRLCVEVWLQHESGPEQRAWMSPLVPPHCLPHHTCWAVWWWQVPAPAEPPGNANLLQMLCTHLRWAAAQTDLQRKEWNCTLSGGWWSGLESRGREQNRKAAGCLFLFCFFFQMEDVLCFLQQHKRCCWGAEREEGGINRKVKEMLDKGNSVQGEKIWNCFKANLPLTVGSWPASLNRLCNLL